MQKKSTDELLKIIENADAEELENFISYNESEMFTEENAFSKYMKSLFKKYGLKQQEVFFKADFPMKYGYRIISGEKHTRQRDYIIRLCLAGEFSLEEVQRALQIYGMSRLYARMPRDVIIISAIQKGINDIFKVNKMLSDHDMPPLKSCPEKL